MSYSNVLPLSEVKNYLRIDEDFTDDDDSIARMTKAALQFIEQRTNHLFFQRDKTYLRGEKYINIFDYPVSYTGDLTKLDYAGKTVFDADSVTVQVGYEMKEDIPAALLEAALQMIKVFYYESEKQVNTTLIPESVHQILNDYRRFTVI